MMFTLLVSALLSQAACAAAYDPKPIEYRNVVADSVQVEHDRIMDGVDEFIITGKKERLLRNSGSPATPMKHVWASCIT